MKIRREVFDEILNTCPRVPPETGGLLGGRNGVVTRFFADAGQGNGYDRYEPDVRRLNAVLADWQRADVAFYGVYHSHFPQGTALSAADIRYIESILRATANEAEVLYFPIILPKKKMISYRAVLAGGQVHIQPDGITLV